MTDRINGDPTLCVVLSQVIVSFVDLFVDVSAAIFVCQAKNNVAPREFVFSRIDKNNSVPPVFEIYLPRPDNIIKMGLWFGSSGAKVNLN